MAINVIKGNTKVAVEAETTEGTYAGTPTATDFVQPLEDGHELVFNKNLVERTVLNNSIGKSRPRVGTRSASGTIPVELIGSGVEGEIPDWGPLMKAGLGTEAQLAARVTTGTGHTTTVINIEDADIGDFSADPQDIILVLESGAHHLSPVIAVDATPGSANITLLVAADSAFSDNVEIAKFTKYTPANSGHDSLSVTFFEGDEIDRRGLGMRPSSISLDNFTTGAVASLNFSLEGIDFSEQDGSSPVTPTFAQVNPPLILEACVFVDGTRVDMNEVGLSIENTIAQLPATCTENGSLGSRITNRDITGTITPYLDDTTTANYTRFVNNTEFSLFFYAANPGAVDGEYELGSIVAFFLPQCIITERPFSDIDGVIFENISFIADRDEDGSKDEIIVSLI